MKTNVIMPPKAHTIPHEQILHGEKLVDNYKHLRKLNSNTKKYLKQESEYTNKMMEHTKELQQNLYHEMKSRITEEDISVPSRYKDYLYYNRSEKGKQYTIYCRKRADVSDAPEEVLLDLNAIAEKEDAEYVYVDCFKVSPNQNLLAYTIDFEGDEVYTINFKDLTTGELLENETIRDVGDSLEWANDSKTIFYTIQDSALRAHKVVRHILGESNEQYQHMHEQDEEYSDEDSYEDVESDESEPLPNNYGMIIYHEKDRKYHVEVSKTLSEQIIFIDTDSNVTSETYVINANDTSTPTSIPTMQVVSSRQDHIEYGTTHWENYFYIRENSNQATNFRLVRIPTEKISEYQIGKQDSFIQLVLEHDSNRLIDYAIAFKNHLAIFVREDGLPKLMIMNHNDYSDFHYVSFPDAAYDLYASDNETQDTDKIRLCYSSFTTPDIVYDYDMNKRELITLKELRVSGEFDRSKYETERRVFTARDGAKIPISMVYKKLETKEPRPLLLYGYGAYGEACDPFFNSNLISLLDRDIIMVICHIRGGGELGRDQYLSGKLLNKKNTFNDFVDCTEYLIENQLTTSGQICITGASAGGLLIGACVNERPELFRAGILKVPFVDAINSMLDPELPLVVVERDEWGDPLNDQEAFKYMKTYSPYDNIDTNKQNIGKQYPALLVTGGLNDPRVSYAEPTKYVAKLRAYYANVKKGKGTDVLLLKMNMDEGHGGKTGRFDRLHDTSFTYAFIIDQIINKRR